MADINISITIPEALVPRIGEALGVSTKAEFETWVKDEVKRRVVAYEADKAFKAEDVKVKLAEEARRQASEDADTQAKTEINL